MKVPHIDIVMLTTYRYCDVSEKDLYKLPGMLLKEERGQPQEDVKIIL